MNTKKPRDEEEVFMRRASDDRRAGKARFSLGRAFSCAWAGISYAFCSQRNLKIHLGFAIAAVILGFALAIDTASWCAVVICIALVMALELLNTAIESVVDLVSPQYHLLAKHAKDCAAGAVYLAAFAAVVVAALVYLPPLISLARQLFSSL